ncbi:penicillin-binding protein 2 [Nodosilinea sp. LEGE 06152]|uniref:peptidoglycan D,D-transpeptidase FtsI family protein n=1 Tax=Nodosilinea sp. LEGE 06152 TaxID=2777966 RepID=UPI001881250F|nr:penicillin-binding protein 2 [Nodosilinea sp. LEGE 06152]MBE9156474.1 penicillin-binding protein 2 [Nodosilinea sp. LEGE 06152]
MTNPTRTSARRNQGPARQRQLLPVKSRVVAWRRVALVWLLLMLALVGIGGRLVYLQLLQGDTLSALAKQQRTLPTLIRQARYPIVDRFGGVLATDQVAYTLYMHPKLFKQPVVEVAEALSPVVAMPQNELLNLLSQQTTGIRFPSQLSEAVGDRLRNLRIDGLELVPQQQRFYPQQELFAPIVGFINLDGKPQAGLEMAYAEQLAIAAPSSAAPAVPSSVRRSSQNASLRLTLDSRLQRIAQQELEAVVKDYDAQRGTVMVIDAPTGEILTLASVPTYDPNRYYEADISAFRTWTVSDTYEPGSTFKPINVAIALEDQVISPNDVINDSGRMQFGKWLIKNSDYNEVGARGPISITDILKYSSNVGMVQIMQKMAASDYFNWLERLTLGQPTEIDLPSEAHGQMKPRDKFINSQVETATTSFGQGFALTPIKMLQLLATLANGGNLVTPHIVEGMVAEDGTYLWQTEHADPKAVFSPQTTQQVLAMMEAVVAEGTGKPAQIEGYRVAGKTGTAQKVNNSTGYSSARITSFVGIAPVEDPRYVVLAVIDEPTGENAYGSTVAAPLVKRVMESLLVLQGVSPSRPERVQ